MFTAKTSKRLQITQAQLQEISYAPGHNQETSMLKPTARYFYLNRIIKKNV